MARPLRIDVENGWHHVMNRGIDHRDVFFDDSDRIEFGQRLADVYDRFGVHTHAYCLMGNHYHLLQHCPDGGLSEAMQRLASLYTRHVNDRLGRDGPLAMGDDALMEVFEIGRRGTLRTAMSRARALLRSEPELREVQARAVSLLAVTPITSRSDP